VSKNLLLEPRQRCRDFFPDLASAPADLAQEARLDFGLCENVRADEKLTAFLELVAATRSTGAAAAWDAA
jgi:hypothetical protein